MPRVAGRHDVESVVDGPRGTGIVWIGCAANFLSFTRQDGNMNKRPDDTRSWLHYNLGRILCVGVRWYAVWYPGVDAELDGSLGCRIGTWSDAS